VRRPVFALFAFALFAFAMATTVAFGKDIAGSKDYALVGRYKGAEISFYNVRDFNKASLLKSPLDGSTANAAGEHHGAEWLEAQGRDTQIRYDGPAGRSSLEVIENLKASLLAKGVGVEFECADAQCFSGSMNDPYLLGWAIDGAQMNGRYADHARYLLASLDRPEGKVYVGLLVGESAGSLTEYVHVVELKPIEMGKIVFVDADAMQKSLSLNGHVALYGIFFDTDRDTPKPESKPTLEQIAKLLRANLALKLVVAGHTDNQGAFDYNVDLSRRRAASIVASLVGEFGIAKDRLTPFGAGMAAPAGNNATEEGRANNRRVELVER
jgi:outer membrane protein OmpA-like peptidoglycan-associated protein